MISRPSNTFLLLLLLGVVVLTAAAFAVYASVTPAQPSSQQAAPPAVAAALRLLSGDAMTLFEDVALTKEITSADGLDFEVIHAQPPLDKLFGGSAAKSLFLRNDSETPLSLTEGQFEIGPAKIPQGKYKVDSLAKRPV